MEYKATQQNFQDLINSDLPVLVDFSATWCGPCRALAPTIEAVASEYDGKAVVVKCDVDECEDAAMQYGIRNIPTILFFKKGQLQEGLRLVGNVPKAEITQRLDSLL
jgi:thioredoxin 1